MHIFIDLQQKIIFDESHLMPDFYLMRSQLHFAGGLWLCKQTSPLESVCLLPTPTTFGREPNVNIYV